MKLYKSLGLLVLSCYFFACSTNTEKIYYPNGKLKRVVKISNGKWNGLYTSYYENGQVSARGQYINGAKTGEHLYYDTLGKLRQQIFFKNDSLNGVFRTYFSNGNLEEDCLYRSNKATGVCLEYYPNGLLNSMCSYKDNKRDGERYITSTDGRLTEYTLYKNNTLLYYKKYDSISGKPLYEFRNVYIECKDTFKEGEYFEGKIKFFGPLDQNNKVSKVDLPNSRIVGQKELYDDYTTYIKDSGSYRSSGPLKIGKHVFEVIICLEIDTAYNEVLGKKKFIVLPDSSKLGPFKIHKSFIGFDDGIVWKWYPKKKS